MYFLALRNVRCFSALHTDVLVLVARGILTVCVIICYQVYKVFFADSRSLDGISRYRSVNLWMKRALIFLNRTSLALHEIAGVKRAVF